MNVCILFNLLENAYITVGALASYSWHIFAGEVVSPLSFEKFTILGGMGKHQILVSLILDIYF